MLTLLARTVLFLSSYAPLFLILGIRAWPSSVSEGAVFIAIALVSIVGAALLITAVDTVGKSPMKVISSSSKSGETTGYLVTYVLPFLGLGANSLPDILALVVLLVTFGLVFVHSDLVLVNPVLATMGYRLFEIEVPEGQRYLIISRSPYPPRPGTDIQVRRLGPAIAKVA